MKKFCHPEKAIRKGGLFYYAILLLWVYIDMYRHGSSWYLHLFMTAVEMLVDVWMIRFAKTTSKSESAKNFRNQK